MKSHPVGDDVNQAKVDHPNLVTRADESLDLNLSCFRESGAKGTADEAHSNQEWRQGFF